MSKVDFVFCVHHHLPADQPDHYFQRAYDESILPLLEAVEKRPDVRICAHYSGTLLEWLQKNRLDFFIRLRNLVDSGHLELLGGGFYEPFLPLIPRADLEGQVEKMADYLYQNFGSRPEGVWTPEGFWEPHLVETLARLGVKYVVLDDRLVDPPSRGRFLAEHSGELISVFPASGRHEGLMPFRDLSEAAEKVNRMKGELFVFAEDGDATKSGWADRLFTELSDFEDIRFVTFSEALERPSVGRVAPHTGDHRKILSRHPEANLMYGRMLNVSRRMRLSDRADARNELYRGQCSTGYFRGLSNPDMRCSVYRHLIQAERMLDGAGHGCKSFDLNLDGRDEIRMYNSFLNVFLNPHQGGHVQELDVRPRLLNLSGTMSRDSEPYPREGFIDHFLAPGAGPETVVKGDGECADFAWGAFSSESWRDEHGVTASLKRKGGLRLPAQEEAAVRMEKEYFLPRDESEFQVSYTLTNGSDRALRFRFAVEMHVAMCSPSAPGAFLHLGNAGDPRALGEPHVFPGPSLHMQDDWHFLDLEIRTPSCDGFWTHPVFTTEAGGYREYQGTALTAFWDVDLEARGSWGTNVTKKFSLKAVPSSGLYYAIQ